MSQRKLAVQTRRVDDGEWRMIQPEAALCLMFVNTLLIGYSQKVTPLVICKVIPTGYLQSDPHWLFAK